jgi:c-di-GMP-binding flagellar brake protein YcgR
MLMSIPGRLRLPGSDERAWATVFLENISLGGACVHSHLHLSAGERIQLSINFGHDQKYHVNATIVRTELNADGFQSRYGVRFNGLSEEVSDGIARYIKQQELSLRAGVQGFSNQSRPA